VADFRDSWARERWRHVPPWRDYIDRRLEESCVRSADLVVCVTDFIRRDFRGHYPDLSSAKFVTLTNGYDTSEDSPLVLPAVAASSDTVSRSQVQEPPSELRSDSTRLVAHIGDLYGGRRIDTFCEAVESLVKSSKLDPNSIKIVFLGDADPSIANAGRQRAPDLILDQQISFHPRVGWQEAQRLLESADLLLIFQGDHPSVPAKFYEYLRTGKPILAIVSAGALSDIIDATGSGIWADPGDPADIATKFLWALALPVRSPQEVEQLTRQYHYRSLAECLAGWIHDLQAAHQI
jgi:glycosyltransferase involved in cell wall biosynthesis